LRTLVSPWWDGDVPLDLVGVPYPPYHDHLLLGLTLASLSAAKSDGEGLGRPTTGASIDVPGSLHPSEVIEGLELSFRDKVQEIDPSLVAGDDEEYDDWSGDGDVFHYHEWDHQVGDHRTSWVTVRCRNLPPGDPTFVAKTVERYQGEVLLIRRQFERLRPDRIKRYFRQSDGDELDMDALIEALADRAAGAPMTEKLFIRRDKKNRDVAVLFLLDMSDSTDQLVEEGRRVIDVEKEGLVLLAEAINQLDDQYAIMGFSSRGRQQVDVFVIKDFADPYDDDVRARVGGIGPLDYTRLGAALRHATSHVLQQPAAAKLLVLLSDGRPYDLGYGDMRYATEDTKMALYEARQAGVNAFCITVDPHGPDYLEDLFGANRYTVIQNVGHLPTKLPRIYRNLTM
jgi:nitric oxide reductase NorD protein